MSDRTPATFDALTVPLLPGVTLVEASAGTGKTFAITRLVLRLLLERCVPDLSRILVVTFTEKATQELVTRIRGVLREATAVWSASPPERTSENADLFALREQAGPDGGETIRRALASLDDLAVSTIHGFCYRVLAESALESRIPFRTTFLEDDTEPFQRAAGDWTRQRVLQDPGAADIVGGDGESPAAWVTELVRPFRRFPGTRLAFDRADAKQELLADFVTSVDRGFEAEKARRHLLGFDDLLRKLRDVLTSEGSDGPLARRIRSTFGAALIDEFQDTDPTQFPIFSTAFAGCPLFLIGDPKQSIYGFRGADVHAYLAAAKSAGRRYTLEANYRSTPACVEAVRQLFTRTSDPFVLPAAEIGYPTVRAAKTHEPHVALRHDGGAALEWWWIGGPRGANGEYVSKETATKIAVREVANEIVRLHAAGLPCGGIAVLLRTNHQAKLVKRALDDANIPAVVSGDADVLESEEGAELIRLASAIASPADGGTVRAAMATRLWGSTADEIVRLQGEGAEAGWREVLDLFVRARAQWWRRGVALSLGELLARRRTAERLLALPDGERRLTNVRHVLEILHEAWAVEGIAPEGFGAWVARERTVPNTPERRELRLERDAEAVQVLTIHKCKGLQFDVVFCPTLWDFRQAGSGPLGVELALAPERGERVLDLGSSALAKRQEARDQDDLAESVRLAYVALTRAVHRCYVAWGEIGRDDAAGRSALGWLLRPAGGEMKREVLQALVDSSGGVMRVRDLSGEARRQRFSPPVPAAPTLPAARPLSLASGQLDTWRITSYSGLTAGAQTDDARDVDDPIALPALLGRPADAAGFRGFPAGAAAGVALHALLEQVDFRRAGERAPADLVRRTLAEHALLDPAAPALRRVDDVCDLVRRLARAPVPRGGFALGDVPRDAGVREWRFDLSVQHFSADRFARALEHAGSAHARGYAPRLGTLEDAQVTGYLSGYVDLAFEHGGKWWIFDWKSNWLGAADAQYAPASLEAVMWEEHYTLQYHLYALALHRHLRARLPGYDPARHWGGITYVFLRGIGDGGEAGWFRDDVTPELLAALDDAIRAPS